MVIPTPLRERVMTTNVVDVIAATTAAEATGHLVGTVAIGIASVNAVHPELIRNPRNIAIIGTDGPVQAQKAVAKNVSRGGLPEVVEARRPPKVQVAVDAQAAVGRAVIVAKGQDPRADQRIGRPVEAAEEQQEEDHSEKAAGLTRAAGNAETRRVEAR
jgi:hypothetical protein